MIYLVLSALCDTIWTFFLAKSKGAGDWWKYAIGILFAIGSTVLFKRSCSLVVLSIAVVAWSGMTVMFTILWDVFFYKTKIDLKTGFFMLLGVIAILGMNYFSNQNAK